MRIFLIFTLIVFSTTLQAQKISFGVKGGLNYGKTIAPGDDIFMARTSFHAGVFSEIPLKGKFSFHPEIIYSSQGNRFDFSRLMISQDPFIQDEIFVDKSNFLLIPLITRFNFSDIVALEVGPQIGILVSNGSFIDYGPTLGLGIDIRDRFKIQLRSYLGVSNVFRKSIIQNESLSDKTYSGLLQLSVGYAVF